MRNKIKFYLECNALNILKVSLLNHQEIGELKHMINGNIAVKEYFELKY